MSGRVNIECPYCGFAWDFDCWESEGQHSEVWECEKCDGRYTIHSWFEYGADVSEIKGETARKLAENPPTLPEGGTPFHFVTKDGPVAKPGWERDGLVCFPEIGRVSGGRRQWGWNIAHHKSGLGLGSNAFRATFEESTALRDDLLTIGNWQREREELEEGMGKDAVARLKARLAEMDPW